ncbi:MAG TPA: hypothetical protein PKD28_04075 [Candidatus Saccharibacteria bacterium]|nr:hypothetical protein [Candidatus Saccharibacteria bacterium]
MGQGNQLWFKETGTFTLAPGVYYWGFSATGDSAASYITVEGISVELASGLDEDGSAIIPGVPDAPDSGVASVHGIAGQIAVLSLAVIVSGMVTVRLVVRKS